MIVPLILGVFVATQTIENGDFEKRPGRDGSIPGWELSIGAMNGATAPVSVVEIDPKVKHGGRSSLKFSGDNTTRAWQIARQEVTLRPGGKYRLTGWARTQDVRQEKVRGTNITQFANCYLMLILFDGSGEVAGRQLAVPQKSGADWEKLQVELEAPKTARRAVITIFLSMSGTLWIDDLELAIERGEELPAPEVLVSEGFEKTSRIPAGWEEELGARNGDGATRNRIEIDPKAGSPDSPRSLKFSGEESTIQWFGLQRTFAAQPGDAFRFRCKVGAENVRRERVQFANLHIRLVFFDAQGEVVGPARYGNPGTGSFDWKDVEAAGVAPEGTTKAHAGIFLSMSGEAWFDELEITKQPGSMPAYHDWKSLETKHLVLRFPADHPSAARMPDYGRRLDEVFERICACLQVTYDERITMYLYRDGEQGKRLTGQDLDFANPEGRAVHQRPESTLGHEMVHVIALKLGYSQTGLLGEGIAVYLNGAKSEEHHRYAAKLLAEGKLPTVARMLTAFWDQQQGYPAAGSFCGYLIETFGIERFKKLYPLTDPAAAATDILGKSLDTIEQDWCAFLSKA
ncbi:MAG: hypothetical protein AB1486_02955 [Planctomycetota bacterium]